MYKNPLAKQLFIPHDMNQKYSPQASKNQSFQSFTRHHLSESEILMIQNQNNFLREQNQNLKRQLNSLKKQETKESPQVNNLRQTIKKEAGQVKELKMRLQILTKQCNVYEEIIQKMEDRNKRLTIDNKRISQCLEINKLKQDQLEKLTKYAEQIRSQYLELQLKVQASDLQWTLWKEHWEKQRNYYIERINKSEKDTNNRPTLQT